MVGGYKRSFVLLLVCTVFISGIQASGSNGGGENSKRDNMEHLFPLLFLMGSAPPIAHCPAVWVLGILSMAVVLLVGPGKRMN